MSSGRRTKHGCSAAQLAIARLLDQEERHRDPAFVFALDRVLGPNASKTKRGEHSFDAPDQLHEQLRDTGFTEVEVQTIVQDIEFPSVLDYVRFQLLATPMAALLSDPAEFDRQATIKTIRLPRRLRAFLIQQCWKAGGSASDRRRTWVQREIRTDSPTVGTR